MPRGFDDIVASRFYKDAGLWFPLGYDPAASFACRTCRHLRVLRTTRARRHAGGAEAELTQLFARMADAEPARLHQSRRARDPAARACSSARCGRRCSCCGAGWPCCCSSPAPTSPACCCCAPANDRARWRCGRRSGVTRARLVRQLLTESVLLSAAGALLGLLPAWAAVRLIASAGPAELPRLAGLSLDARAVSVAVLLAMASGVLFGLAPLRQLTRRDAGDELRGAGRRTGGVGMWRARAVLVAGNVAMAAVLLAGSGVLVRSVTRLLAVEPGFQPDGVLTMRLWAGGERFTQGETPQQIATAVAFYDDVLTRVRALPGVIVGVVGHHPAAGRRHRRLRVPRGRAADRQPRRCALGRPLRRDLRLLRHAGHPAAARPAHRCPRWIAGGAGGAHQPRGGRHRVRRRGSDRTPGDDRPGDRPAAHHRRRRRRRPASRPRSSAGAAGLRAPGAVGLGRDADDAGGSHRRRADGAGRRRARRGARRRSGAAGDRRAALRRRRGVDDRTRRFVAGGPGRRSRRWRCCWRWSGSTGR